MTCGVEQNPGPGEEGENIVQGLCRECVRILKSVRDVRRVVAGTVTAVEKWRLRWRKAGNGTAIGVDLKGMNYLQRNFRTLCSKLTSCNVRTRHWKSSYNWRQQERKLASGTRRR